MHAETAGCVVLRRIVNVHEIVVQGVGGNDLDTRTPEIAVSASN